jgi:NADPH:quinone reductase-like Zn-dependent oxidoreductase
MHRALMGKRVAAIGGAMYSQYRTVRVADCLPLPAGATAADGASCFVNPLTALAMVETMRAEGTQGDRFILRPHRTLARCS